MLVIHQVRQDNLTLEEVAGQTLLNGKDRIVRDFLQFYHRREGMVL